MKKGAQGKRRRKGGKKGSPFRGLVRLAWGIVMAAILAVFALSMAYRLQEPDSDAVPISLVTETTDSIITVVILNGCGEKGLAADVREAMLPDPRFDVVEVANAADTRYEETLVADVGARAGAAGEVADYLQRRLGVGQVIRHNMADPPADVLVILGADAKREVP